MKKSLWLAVIGLTLVLLNGCMSVDLKVDKVLPAVPEDARVITCYEKSLIPVPEKDRILVGSAVVSGSTSSFKLSDLKTRLTELARQHGANVVLINTIDQVRDGEVRSDQVKNQSSPSWTPIDDSATDIQQQRNFEIYSSASEDLPIYRIEIKAQFFKISDSALIKDEVLIPEQKQPRRTEVIEENNNAAINIRSN
ncbi:MAG: hypothetical protein J6W81_08945 [Lentisphaeria bacterium]|nr:hypothetical protein [Lentisphaeria bacterium]